MSLAARIDFFVHELSNLCQTQLLPRCAVAAVSHLRGNYEKKLNTQTSEISASSDFTAPASVFLFLGTRALFFNFFFPQWEHFYGNWSPCNNSSWYACSTPDSLVTSHTLSSNQLPATSQINKSSLPSPTLDAAALCQRWRQKDRHERGFSTCGPLIYLFFFSV